jgi:hypothetical protein
MTRKLGYFALLMSVAGLCAGLAAAFAGGSTSTRGVSHSPATQQRPLRFDRHDVFIEYNASAGDAGLQLSLDAEDWKHFRLLDTKRDPMVDLTARGRLRPFGLTELFFEASEPSFDELPFSEFQKRFPEGRYRFRGRSVDGRALLSSDRLTHVIPGPPNVTYPTRGALVDPDGFTVRWDRVTTPAGVKIVSYQVIIEQGGREFSVYLPRSARRVRIPGQFLKPDKRMLGEVLAREASGNQTITELPRFRTAPE